MFNSVTVFLYLVAAVIPGSGAETGAGDNGVGEAGQRAGHLSPGHHEMPARLLLRHQRWSGSVSLINMQN